MPWCFLVQCALASSLASSPSVKPKMCPTREAQRKKGRWALTTPTLRHGSCQCALIVSLVAEGRDLCPFYHQCQQSQASSSTCCHAQAWPLGQLGKANLSSGHGPNEGKTRSRSCWCLSSTGRAMRPCLPSSYHGDGEPAGGGRS